MLEQLFYVCLQWPLNLNIKKVIENKCWPIELLAAHSLVSMSRNKCFSELESLELNKYFTVRVNSLKVILK